MEEKREKIINLDAFKKELERRKITEKLNKAKDWALDHPAESIAMFSAGIGGLMGLAKSLDRKHDLKEAQRLKDEYIYDRSMGRYWKTRRKLTTSESLELERRRAGGEPLGQILSDMRLL